MTGYDWLKEDVTSFSQFHTLYEDVSTYHISCRCFCIFLKILLLVVFCLIVKLIIIYNNLYCILLVFRPLFGAGPIQLGHVIIQLLFIYLLTY